jgi:hypothetical protein
MSVPRLVEVARRLELARHDAAVEDLLDEVPSLVRLSVRPWRGPWTGKLSPPPGIFELEIDAAREDQIVARVQLDPEADEPAEETLLQPSRLTAAWLEARVLDFVAKLLARA